MYETGRERDRFLVTLGALSADPEEFVMACPEVEFFKGAVAYVVIEANGRTYEVSCYDIGYEKVKCTYKGEESLFVYDYPWACEAFTDAYRFFTGLDLETVFGSAEVLEDSDETRDRGDWDSYGEWAFWEKHGICECLPVNAKAGAVARRQTEWLEERE